MHIVRDVRNCLKYVCATVGMHATRGGAVRACRYGRGCRHACADSGVHNRMQRLRARVSLLDVRLCGHLFDKG